MNYFDFPTVTNADEFVALVDGARLANKGAGYRIVGVINGKDIEIKGSGTWLQFLVVDEVDASNGNEPYVKVFKAFLITVYNKFLRVEQQHAYEIYTCNPDDPSVTGWDIVHVLSTDSLIAKYPLFDCIISRNDSAGQDLVEFTCLK